MKFNELDSLVKSLTSRYDNFIIGKSLFNKNIYCFHIGSYSGNQVFLNGGIHAREYISSLFLIKELEYLSKQEINGGFYIVPMINPDGIELVLDGLKDKKNKKLNRFLTDINEGSDFSLWKANGNGVDLNVNYDALWGKGARNITKLARENFIGYYPNSEIENINIINFLKKHEIAGNLSFHSKGEVLYYGFKMDKERLKRDFKLAKTISCKNGYKIIRSKKSTGGLSDFISLKYKVPTFTVELGEDSLIHPISEEFLFQIFEKNKEVPIAFSERLNLID